MSQCTTISTFSDYIFKWKQDSFLSLILNLTAVAETVWSSTRCFLRNLSRLLTPSNNLWIGAVRGQTTGESLNFWKTEFKTLLKKLPTSPSKWSLNKVLLILNILELFHSVHSLTYVLIQRIFLSTLGIRYWSGCTVPTELVIEDNSHGHASTCTPQTSSP